MSTWGLKSKCVGVQMWKVGQFTDGILKQDKDVYNVFWWPSCIYYLKSVLFGGHLEFTI